MAEWDGPRLVCVSHARVLGVALDRDATARYVISTSSGPAPQPHSTDVADHGAPHR